MDYTASEEELAKLPLKGDRSCEGQQVWGETVRFLHDVLLFEFALFLINRFIKKNKANE